MSRLAILLVHGFSGCDQDLLPLAARLQQEFGQQSVTLLQLPGHAAEKTLAGFSQEVLLESIASSLEQLRRRADFLLVLGHSTGGNLLLAALERTEIVPDLLVLAATPFRIDLAYLARWQQHRQGREELSLTTLAGLIKLINGVAERGAIPQCPVFLLQGGEDRLVLWQEAHRWQEKLTGEVRLIELPESGHQLFCEPGGDAAAAELVQGISAMLAAAEIKTGNFAQRLLTAEPEAMQFVAEHRQQLRHLTLSPSGRRLLGKTVVLPEIVPWKPVFANIEITTCCNFSCRYCARTALHPAEQAMSLELFEQLLERLPSAYRVTLVGLGEPLLHPQLVEFIALAKARGRRVGMVTNAQLLTPQRSTELLAAGLDSIAFSLDTLDPQLAVELRSGSDLALIQANIRAFCTQAENLSRPVSRAVFSAVSAVSVAGLADLIARVGELGVQVLMLSDLNFSCNQQDSLCAHVDEERERTLRRAVAHGFAQGLPVLGVRALEDFGLAQNYRDALLLPVQQLYRRSAAQRHCVSPWQTLAVNVAGEVCLCDCQPEQKIGNLQQQTLASIWNGAALRRQRRQMLSEQPSTDCLNCPRF